MALPNLKTVLKCRWDTDTQCIVTTSVTQLNEPEWNNTVDTDYNLHTLYNMKMDYSPLLIVLKYSGSCTCSDWVFLKECHLFIQLLFDRGKIVYGFGKEICLYTRYFEKSSSNGSGISKGHKTNYLCAYQSWISLCIYLQL